MRGCSKIAVYEGNIWALLQRVLNGNTVTSTLSSISPQDAGENVIHVRYEAMMRDPKRFSQQLLVREFKNLLAWLFHPLASDIFCTCVAFSNDCSCRCSHSVRMSRITVVAARRPISAQKRTIACCVIVVTNYAKKDAWVRRFLQNTHWLAASHYAMCPFSIVCHLLNNEDKMPNISSREAHRQFIVIMGSHRRFFLSYKLWTRTKMDYVALGGQVRIRIYSTKCHNLPNNVVSAAEIHICALCDLVESSVPKMTHSRSWVTNYAERNNILVRNARHSCAKTSFPYVWDSFFKF